MKPIQLPCRPVAVLLLFGLLGLLFGGPSPVDLLTTAEASSARDQRQFKKMTRQNRSLKRKVRKLRRQLAAAQPSAPFVEMVTIGNVGNAADQDFGDGTFGTVPYEFSIGKYEVSLAQYTAFLNAVAATDAHALYNTNMAITATIAGIERSGSDGSYTYAVIGSGERPVTYVSWFDAARFCNWLHNGRPTGAQDATTTERGAYTLDGATSGGLTISRNPGAKYWIPSEDEWYKAAYHQPSEQGGDGDNYWLYPTGSNAAPTAEVPPGGANSANFNSAVGGITPAGAYTGSASFYGTFDQGGNVLEWNDAVLFDSFRGLRGGSWLLNFLNLQSSARGSTSPNSDNSDRGFRVASP